MIRQQQCLSGWCYSLVESSMKDPVGSVDASVLPVSLWLVGVEPRVFGSGCGVLAHCWALRNHILCPSCSVSGLGCLLCLSLPVGG